MDSKCNNFAYILHPKGISVNKIILFWGHTGKLLHKSAYFILAISDKTFYDKRMIYIFQKDISI